jgi:hypothetical protein
MNFGQATCPGAALHPCGLTRSRLAEEAAAVHGMRPDVRRFCLKIPAVLGGAYAVENVGTIAVAELLHFSGDVAQQIRDLPDGTQESFRFVD